MTSPITLSPAKLASIRAGLPVLASSIYLNTGMCGPLPTAVHEVLMAESRRELEVGRGDEPYNQAFLERIGEARAGVAAILGADMREIAITHATTDGMNLATWAIDWRAGDRAVTTTAEHPGGLGALYAIRERFGVALDFVDVGLGADEDAIVAAFDRAITPGTRLVAFSHVLWTSGAVMPVTRIAAIARARGARIAVDGAQSAGAIPFTVGELGVDYYAVSAQKWLLGPDGSGALWAAPEAIAAAAPSFGGWWGFESVDSRGSAVRRADARRFEITGYHRPSVAAFARALGWLIVAVGLDVVLGNGPLMARRTADALMAVPGVELLTPRDRMGTLVSFRIAGWPAAAATAELADRFSTIVRTVAAADAVRASVGFFNSADELDRFVESVRLLAAHTPDSLPPRRTLPILGEA